MLLRKIPEQWETERNFLYKISPVGQRSQASGTTNIFICSLYLNTRTLFYSVLAQKLICLTLIVILLIDAIILISHRENEPPNQAVLATILKEVKEIEQIQNDSLCTERRIIGMFE